jgi:hypothetical protein
VLLFPFSSSGQREAGIAWAGGGNTKKITAPKNYLLFVLFSYIGEEFFNTPLTSL